MRFSPFVKASSLAFQAEYHAAWVPHIRSCRLAATQDMGQMMVSSGIALRAGRLVVVALMCFVPFASAGERWALLIGVNGYQALGTLEYCVADARALGEVLVRAGGYPASHVVTLTDDADTPAGLPTLANVRRRTKQIAELAQPADTVFVFFSGHGVTRAGEGFLVPLDGDAETAVSLAWVRDQLRSSRAARKVLVLDACHAGSAAKGVSGIVPELASGSGLVMLLSSGRDQVSYPDEGQQHSVFTRQLLEGLSGKAAGGDKDVTAEELFAYVSKQLREWSFQSGKTQTPVLVGDGAAELVLVTVSATPVLPPSSRQGPVVPDVKSAQRQLPPDLVAVPDAEYAPLDGLADGSREAQERQKQAVEDLGLPLGVKSRKTGILFRLIPAGMFVMGSPATEPERYSDETPHRVTLTQPFYCGKFEVTQGQWRHLMGKNPSRHASVGDDGPVEWVKWSECQEFCRKLCALEGAATDAYRLLSEAQWEYACRGGTSTPFCYGDSLDSSMANFCGERPYGRGSIGVYRDTTIAVGQFRPNAWGLYDMHDNVSEWCRDWFGDYPPGSVTDPEGPGRKSHRVCRGGNFGHYASGCRSAFRVKYNALIRRRTGSLGFRLLRVVP